VLDFTSVKVTNDDSGGDFRINNVAVSQVTTTAAPDLDYNFTLNVVDKDGDAVAQNFSVHLDGDTTTGTLVVEAIACTSGADTLYGTGANDVIIGGGGSDTLTGGTGADTFKWTLADANATSVPIDHVTDFMENAGDKLDLRDLLEGAGATNEAIGNYLSFNSNGTDTTITIKSQGTGGSVDQTIVLDGVDLIALYGSGVNDPTIIVNNLIAAGKLIVD